MANISVENYQNVGVPTMTVTNSTYFWIKMNHVQTKLGLKKCMI